jgi:hypothetical protein
MDYLTHRDYICARSAGSHGPIDVFAVYFGDYPDLNIPVRLIQSKTNRHYSETDLTTLRMMVDVAVKNKIPVTIELWNWNDRAREPEITILGSSRNDDKQLF